MPQQPTEREKELARRVAELETQLGRPQLSGGVITDTTNLILGKVPTIVLRVAAYLVLAYMGVSFFFDGKQLIADTGRLQAEAASKAAKVGAAQGDLDHRSLQAETLKAEIQRTQAAAAQARAEATAQGTTIAGKTVRLRTIEAEVAATQAEADKIGAQLDAMAQIVNGTTPLAIAQRSAEVKKIEAAADAALAEVQPILKIQIKRYNGG